MIDARRYFQSSSADGPARFGADGFPAHPRETSLPTTQDPAPFSAAGVSAPQVAGLRGTPRSELRSRRLAADILAAVQSRLPGRIRDLKVRVDGEQFVLSGVSSSYYVKQVAQHIAMTALEAVALGQIVNEIEVRSPR